MTEARPKRIAERLRGQRLLVTGSTGLLAKVFVEKLLRSFPDVGGIDLLVRSRADGTDGHERLRSEVLGSSVFHRLRASLGMRFDDLCRAKLRAVCGDLTRPLLGLSEAEFHELASRIDIIVNSAAAVTFDERLDLALELNTLGPTRLLELSAAGGGTPFMQVSTCYVCGARSGDMPESLSPPPGAESLDIDAVTAEMRRLVRDVLATGAPDSEDTRARLIDAGMSLARRHGWNDTYTFTKWIGEQLTDRLRGNAPTVILRPAIIEGSLEEPMPGWIDGLRMADPMIMAYGRGKLDEFPADPGVRIDVIPVDLVSNAMIAALPMRGDAPGLRVYQVGSSSRNPLRVGELIGYLEEYFRERPLADESGKPVRPGRFRLVRREAFFEKWQARLERALEQRRRLEAAGAGASTAARREAGLTVARIEQLIYFARIYSPYTHLDCRFLDDRLQSLAMALDPDERRELPFDVSSIDWRDYVVQRHIPGLRRFVMGGSDSAAPAAPARPARPDPVDAAIRRELRGTRSIFEAFERAARRFPDKPALQMNRAGSWICYNYAEALAATAAVARRLSEYGLETGDRVAIYGENCPEWGLTYLGVMRAGMTAVPLDPQLPAADVFALSEFAGAKLICAGKTTMGALRTAAGETLSAIRNSPFAIVELAEPFVPPPGAWREPAGAAAGVAPDQIASILFTSGTTLAPKAVALTHTNLLANVNSLLAVHPLDSRESFVSVLPMYHAFEFTGGFLVPMSIGATVTYVEQLKGPEVMAAMRAARVTVMMVVPRLLKLFHDSIHRRVSESSPVVRAYFAAVSRLSDWTRGRLGKPLFRKVHGQFGGRLRMFVSGGSALDAELFAGFSRMGFEVCEGYGLTETSPVLAVSPPRCGRPGSVGKALPGIDLEIRNPNPEGIGELWARGANVMSGYLHSPAATAEVIQDGWFRTGDLCRCDEEGFFYLTGRVKDMIVTDAGKNVYPDEVQARYKDLPYVKELCVVGLPSATGIGESVHAVVVPDFEAAPDVDPSSVERAIREAAAEIAAAIPSHQRIQALHFWSTELPKTSTLKAKRGVVRERLLAGEEGQARPEARNETASAARASAMEGGQNAAVIRALLSRLTRKPESAINRDSHLLLDLGVDSLMKLQIITELEATFDLTCPDDTAVRLARVSDLLSLVGDRRPAATQRRAGESWHKRLHPEEAAAGSNGQLNGSPALMPARWALRGSVGLFFNSYVRVSASGLEHIPGAGPFILAANHTSHLDSASVITALRGRRRVWVAGAQDYFFDTRFKSFVFGRLFDTIPFDRQTEGIAGLRRCVQVLEHGDGLLFFPEGTRSTSGLMQPFKLGVALMAIAARAPVIPTRIENAYELLPKGKRWLRPGQVQVSFGPAIDAGPWISPEDLDRQYQLYRELTRHVEEQVATLKFSRDPKGSAKPGSSERGVRSAE